MSRALAGHSRFAKAPGEPRPSRIPQIRSHRGHGTAAGTPYSGLWLRLAGWRHGGLAGRVLGSGIHQRHSSSAVERRLAPRNSRLISKPRTPAAVGRSPVALFARSSTAALSCSGMDAKSVWPRSKCRRWRCPRKAALHRKDAPPRRLWMRSPGAMRSRCDKAKLARIATDAFSPMPMSYAMVISSSYKESSSPKDLPGVGDRVVRPCSDDLLNREKSARADKLGLWADPYYEVLNAECRGTCWRIEANSRWSRAKLRPYGKAGLQSLSISGGGGRVISRLRS